MTYAFSCEQEVVLSPTSDAFYRVSQYLNFGDLGTSVKDLVQNYQKKNTFTRQTGYYRYVFFTVGHTQLFGSTIFIGTSV